MKVVETAVTGAGPAALAAAHALAGVGCDLTIFGRVSNHASGARNTLASVRLMPVRAE